MGSTQASGAIAEAAERSICLHSRVPGRKVEKKFNAEGGCQGYKGKHTDEGVACWWWEGVKNLERE